ncbi:tRNA 2-selenouridine(34) synthase MnmH [Bacillota bacterium LX-D]|nr:tRNA 2-selenouridine(34) synthase MnmH [Bacillota bacterium LX-D]
MPENISIEEALAMEDAVFIDVRSPGEFAEDNLPGAINIPILDDEQRCIVGTTYKQQGPNEARVLGMDLVSAQIPEKIRKIQDVSKDKKIIVYCWRGGLRSKAMSQLLDLAGIDSYRLLGGYKAYRKYINDYYINLEPINFLVLYGLTGVGKSEIIANLDKLGMETLDLEKLANHRGSVFGGVGLKNQPSQKRFESSIYRILQEYKNSKAIVVEGESRKVGKLIIPEVVYRSMQNGTKILVYNSIENRINRILQEYLNGSTENLKGIERSIIQLQRRIGKSKTKDLLDKLWVGQYDEIVEELLLNYYDPLYKHPESPSEVYDLSINAEDIEQAALQIKNYIETQIL